MKGMLNLMLKMKRIKNLIICSMTAIILMVSMMPVTIHGAAEATINITGLKLHDKVEIYRIAAYGETSGTYSWASAVSNWMENSTDGSAYRTITPDKLSAMTPDRAKEFCELLILGLKNESDGIANVSGYSFTVDEEKDTYSISASAGYYVVLPKGSDRIYEIKWLAVAPGGSYAMSYAAGTDYQVPAISGSAKNLTTDRGVNNDTDKNPIALQSDSIEINGVMDIPKYPNMYSTGKRILNVTAVLPRGVSYTSDTLSMHSGQAANDASGADTTAYTLMGKDSYSVQQFDDCYVYTDTSNKILFIGTGSVASAKGYFYEIDGDLLGSEIADTDAISKYNKNHGTDYVLKKTDTSTSKSDSTTSDTSTSGSSTSDTGSSTSGTTATEETGQTDTANDVTYQGGHTAFIVSLNTDTDLSRVKIKYKVTKGDKTTDTGIFGNNIFLSYSISPLDSNLKGQIETAPGPASYGIRITVSKGDGYSVTTATADILKDMSKRLSKAGFFLYKKSGVTYKGDKSNGITDTLNENTKSGDNNTSTDPQLLYKEKEDLTYEYTYVASLDADSNGVAEISGIEPAEYLIVQTVYPDNYTRSQVSLLISETDWTDDKVMEGHYLMDTLWLDYKTVYLPGTGKHGIVIYAIIGVILCMGAMGILLYRIRPGAIIAALHWAGYRLHFLIKKFFRKR